MAKGFRFIQMGLITKVIFQMESLMDMDESSQTEMFMKASGAKDSQTVKEPILMKMELFMLEIG